MHPGSSAESGPGAVKIVVPFACEYHGGNRALGGHGRHLRIEDGRIGHGELHLTHSIPMADVTSVDVAERQVGGSGPPVLLAFGTLPRVGQSGSTPKQVTDITVWTDDGQSALWTVEHRGAAWVKDRLGPTLRTYGVPFTEDLPPGERPR